MTPAELTEWVRTHPPQGAPDPNVTPPEVKAAALREELERVHAKIKRRQWSRQPAAWIRERLGEELWSKQAEILEALTLEPRLAVPSCFASGKSWLAARIAAWWVDTHPPGTAFVVTTASSWSQVRAILWRELARAHAKGKLPGRLNQTEWHLPMPDGREELVAFGRKPADLDTTAFQGIHAFYVLVLLDEAAGVHEALWRAADALATNDASRVLAFGNPEDGASHFAKICKPGSGWRVIRIRAWDTPNFSGEAVSEDLKQLLLSKSWVERKRKEWGEKSAFWLAKVEAEFPDFRPDGLFPIQLIRQAQEKSIPPGLPVELGVDVGGGGNKSIIALRRGGWVRIVLRNQNPDTMAVLGEVAAQLKATGATCAKADEIGIGRGLVDRARELRLAVLGINIGMPSKDPEHFANLRAQAYWGLRERLEAGEVDIDPEDEDLAAQLVEIRYKRTSAGKIQIEGKDEMARRGVSSPDELDAVVLSFIPPDMAPRPPRVRQVEWG